MGLPFIVIQKWLFLVYVYTVDRENFIVKKITWDKCSMRFNFVKAESIVCTSTI